ncbi:MAG TPA: CAP domain-containing protein, partial [Chthoniobacterales bacterium]|nr:CAP domain-containing protein [Chthoniobacterales bacterium]
LIITIMRHAIFLSLFAAVAVATRTYAADDGRVTSVSLVREMNMARQNPALYASYVEQMRSNFNGTHYVMPGGTRVRSKEGARALDDAIRFLKRARPQSPLTLSPGMCRASADHCADQAGGRKGHNGSDRSNPGARISRYGEWGGAWGENISYGKTNARDIIIGLIIDDGLPARKHRKNIFNPKFNVAGAAFGPHAGYRTVCSMDFAGSYVERGSASGTLVARGF